MSRATPLLQFPHHPVLAWPRSRVRLPETRILSPLDDPAIREKSKLRLDVAITVPEETPRTGKSGGR
jgi:hypothetical protein